MYKLVFCKQNFVLRCIALISILSCEVAVGGYFYRVPVFVVLFAFIIPPLDQTGRPRHCFWVSVLPSIHNGRCQTCVHNILKVNEPILMQICISGVGSKGTKQLTFGVRGSNVKVT